MIPCRVELGAGDGKNAERMIAEPGGTVWVYDTFYGFPLDTLWDGESRGACEGIGSGYPGVKDRLEYLGAVCVDGRFPESFWKSHPVSVSSVHIDMDTYITTISALELFDRVMIPGGAFNIHDWDNGGLPGVKRAVDEFLAGPFGTRYEHYKLHDHYVVKKADHSQNN